MCCGTKICLLRWRLVLQNRWTQLAHEELLSSFYEVFSVFSRVRSTLRLKHCSSLCGCLILKSILNRYWSCSDYKRGPWHQIQSWNRFLFLKLILLSFRNLIGFLSDKETQETHLNQGYWIGQLYFPCSFCCRATTSIPTLTFLLGCLMLIYGKNSLILRLNTAVLTTSGCFAFLNLINF